MGQLRLRAGCRRAFPNPPSAAPARISLPGNYAASMRVRASHTRFRVLEGRTVMNRHKIIYSGSAAVAASAALGLAACSTVTNSAPPASPAPGTSSHAHPAPSTSPPAGSTPQGGHTGTTSPPAAVPVPVPNVTSPWAVVAAYYGDIESGNYAEAWALIGSGSTTGQSYQDFVNGFACTGSQQVTDEGTSGNQVTFSLAATAPARVRSTPIPARTPCRTAP